MYHCYVRLYFVGSQRWIPERLNEISPLEYFTHEFIASDTVEQSLTEQADVIIADLCGQDAAETVRTLAGWKNPRAELILLADKAQVEELAGVWDNVMDIWTLPISETELRYRFDRWQRAYAARVEAWQTAQYLEATINSVPNLIWYKDKNGIHEKVNDSFCQVVGKSKEQVQGRGHAYIWDVEQDDPACIESERIVMEKQETCISEETIMTGEGEKLLTTYKSPLYDWDGSVMGTVGVAIDITRERAYADELIKKSKTLETLFATMDCGVMCHSMDGSRIISINRAALSILGYASQEELKEAGFDLVSPSVVDEDKPKLAQCIRSLKQAGDTVNVEYCVQHKDGNILYVMGSVKLMEENGERFYQRYLFDCTAQKLREVHERQAEEQRQMELIHALSIEYSLVCYFDLDTGDGQVLRIGECKNNVLQSIFTGAISLERCMEQYIEAGVYPEDKEMFRQAVSRERLEKELLEKSLSCVNYRTTCCGETRYFQAKAVRAGEWSENRGIVLGLCSVDEETRDEMEKKAVLEDALSRANQANKAKSTFLSNMSHDIRTPMNAIIGFTTLALSNIEKQEQVKEYLEKIMTSGNHLLSLINDVLDMSHIESGKLEFDEQPCNLSEILHELHNIIQADAHAKELDLYMDAVDIQHENICCDNLRLNQVLLNLLSNAVKYNKRGGMVVLKVSEKVSDVPDFANYEFRVKDTGVGMSKEFVKHIFEPFERERNSTVSGIWGTGLGMTITKNIIDRMNGSIEIISEQGVGTECIVSLTFRLHSTKNEAKSDREEAAAPSAELRTGRILLVEDNELNQEIAEAILEGVGFSAEVASNGQIAVEMLKNSEPGYYKMVLMDIQMPVMNGYEATKAMRKLENKALASIPILAMTANAFEEDKQEALRSGMDGHIAKPIDIEKLLETMDDILNRKEQQM